MSAQSQEGQRPNTVPDADTENAQPKSEEPEYLQGTTLYLLIFALLLVVLLMAIDISIVATALPRITDTFHKITDIGWYGAAYTFTNSSFQPLAGKIYTFFSMKIAFIVFIVVFELGSLLCATANSSAMFIVGRAIAGIGSSGLVNGSLSIAALAGPPDTRPMLMGLIMSIAGAGQLLGPLIGGALTSNVSWRWCFYINLPAGAVTVGLITIFIRFPSEEGRRKPFVPKTIVKDFDLIGFSLFCPAVIMFMMALQWGGTIHPWNSATIIGLLCGFAGLLVPLFYWEYRHGKDAMFPWPLLRLRKVYFACMTGFLLGGSMLVIAYYLPLWFQTVKFADPLQSAVDTLPSFLSQMLFSIVSGILCPRIIPYLTPFAITGAALTTIGTGLMTTFLPSTATGSWIGFQILAGSGRGFSLQSPVQTVQQTISKSDLAVGTAVVAFFQFFGGSMFIAIAQTVFSNLLTAALKVHAPGVDPALVLGSGATDVRNLVQPDQVAGVVSSYNDAVTKTIYLAVGAAGVSAFTAVGLGFKKMERRKKPAKEKAQQEIEVKDVEKM